MRTADIICLENSRKATGKCLETRGEFIKVDGYKVNILKLIAFLHANNSQLEGIIKGKNPIYDRTRKTKDLGISKVTIKKTLKCYSETKKEANRWKTCCVL